MHSFNINLFRQPEFFIALELGMHTYTPLFLNTIEKILHRTKSPPIAINYTYQFLKDKTEEELSLDVIRFVSQLADLSPGVSMSSSLYNILRESGFLTELRHSLTHKTMVKGSILQLARKLILDELHEKYWEMTRDSLVKTYNIDKLKVQSYFEEIYNCKCPKGLEWLKPNYQLEYFLTCSNYEYKEHVQDVITKFVQRKITRDEFVKHFQTVSFQKQILFVVLVLQIYVEVRVSDWHYERFILEFIKQIDSSFLGEKLIMRELQKAYFMRYLKHAGNLIQVLPEETRKTIEIFWLEYEKNIGGLYTPSM